MNFLEDSTLATMVIKLGLVTEKQVEKCLKLQKEILQKKQKHIELSTLLLKNGYIKPAKLKEVEEKIHSNIPLLPKEMGRYEILELLGEGGMGKVYKAYDPRLKREVAIKLLQKSAEHKERFLQEANILSNLSHPNIVSIYDIGEWMGNIFLVMEYLQGDTLDIAIKEKKFSLKEILSMMAILGKAVHYLHNNKIIHRDLKPSNIIIEANSIKILDFGLAKNIVTNKQLTQEGMIVGTLEYMSPEQINGAADLDQKSDLYSLGVIFYLMLTKTLPFTCERLENFLFKLRNSDPLAPSYYNPVLPIEIDIICLKTIEKQKQNRYESVLAFVEDIERFLNNQPIHAKPLGKIKKIGIRLKQNSRILMLCFLCFFIFLSIYLLFLKERIPGILGDSVSLGLLELQQLSQKVKLENKEDAKYLSSLIQKIKNLGSETVQDKEVKQKIEFLLKHNQLRLEQFRLAQYQSISSKIASILDDSQQEEKIQQRSQEEYSFYIDELTYLLENQEEKYEILWWRAQIYERIGDYSLARKDYESCLKIKKFPLLEIKIAFCAYYQKDIDFSQKILENFFHKSHLLKESSLVDVAKVLMEIAFEKKSWEKVEFYFCNAFFKIGDKKKLKPLQILFFSMGKKLLFSKEYSLAKQYFTQKELYDILEKECQYFAVVCDFYLYCFQKNAREKYSNQKYNFIHIRQHSLAEYRSSAYLFIAYIQWKSRQINDAEQSMQKSFQYLSEKKEFKNSIKSIIAIYLAKYPESSALWEDQNFQNFVEKIESK